MNVDPLKNVLDRFESNQIYTQSQINKIVKGMQKLTKDLQDGVEKIGLKSFRGAYHMSNFDTENDVKQRLNEVEVLLSNLMIRGYKQKIDANKIEKIGTDCSSRIADIKSRVYFKGFNLEVWIKNNSIKEYGETLDKVFAKCQKIQTQIKLKEDKSDVDSDITKSIMLRIKKLISLKDIDYGIRTLPEENYKLNVCRYKALKTAWTKSFIPYKSLETFVDRSLISSKIKPDIENFSREIQTKGEYFTQLNGSLEKIGVSFLDEGFKKDYQSESEPYVYRRNFHSFYQNVRTYVDFKKQWNEKEKVLNELEKSRNDLKTKVEASLNEITQKIESLKKQAPFTHLAFNEMRKEEILSEKNEETNLIFMDRVKSEKITPYDNKEGIVCLDNEIDHAVQELLTDSLKKLELLREEIINQWKTCCLNIEKIKFQKELFLRISDTTENLSLCYFLAEDIHTNFRTLRKTENDINAHIRDCIINYDDNSTLCNLIFYHLYAENKILNSRFNELLNKFENKALTFSLRSDCQRVISLPESVINCSPFAAVYSSDIHKEKIENEFEQQKNIFIKELKKHQEIIRLSFTEKLAKVCDYVTKGINKELVAFRNHGKDPGYYSCFKQAFKYDDLIGSTAFEPIRSIRDTGYSLGKTVTNYFGVYIEEPKRLDEAGLSKILAFKDAVSPFEKTLKDSI